MEIFQSMAYWHWLVLGVALLVLEMFAPGVLFVWMGIAAGVVGGILWAMPELGWQTQWLLFAVLSVVSIVMARLLIVRSGNKTDEPTLNRRGEQYVGRVFTLEQAMVNGIGKIRVDDTTWKVSGADCAAGAQVRVIGTDGVVLKVELA